MSEKTINKVPNVPNLRFRNFNNTWIKKSFLDLVKVKARMARFTSRRIYERR